MQKLQYWDLSATDMAKEYIASCCRTRNKCTLLTLVIIILMICLEFFCGLPEVMCDRLFLFLAALIVFVHSGVKKKELSQHKDKLAAVLYDDINPQKYAKIFNELEKIYPPKWDRVFLLTEQAAAYFYLPDAQKAYDILKRISLSQKPLPRWVDTYDFLASCAYETGQHEARQEYMVMLETVRQNAKPRTEVYERVSDIIYRQELSLKSFTDWNETDLSYFETLLEKKKSRLGRISILYTLAAYEIDNRNLKAARTFLEYVYECKYPNVFLIRGEELLKKIADLEMQAPV